MSLPYYLLWVDLETDGTDEIGGHILEIGTILTDRELNTLWRFQSVVSYGPAATAVIRSAADPVVQEMHDKNGLWEDVAKSDGPMLWELDQKLRGLLDQAGTKPVALAGSGVAHFDGRWIRRHLPDSAERLTYWAYDVGVLRRTFQRLGLDQFVPTINNTKPHRAMDDLELHLQEARRYDWLLKLLPATVDSYDRYIEGLENP